MPSNLINKILFEGLLKEVGELKDFSFDFTGPNTMSEGFEYKYYIDAEKQQEVNVVFEEATEKFQERFQAYFDHSSIYNIFYTVNEDEVQYKKTALNELIEILSTNFKIIADFVAKFSPGILLVNGNYKTDEIEGTNGSKKSILYGAIIDKNISKLYGYRYTTTKLDNKNFYVIYKGKVE